ncbi:MAG: branched-chain amino acid ABC transporter substrate-binding protein [Alphaproteobacteria bacterium]|nr:MAG: branched-chain amino acid ABC transporter substrate-binding protein [Alphaproteobacteria bacterium]
MRRIILALVFLVFATPAFADTVLGIAGPFTGQMASFGEQFKRGADMAVSDINAKGGVLGQKIALAYGDDACDPKQAVAVANQLVSKKIAAVIGHFCSGSSIPASEVYAEENIVMVSPGSSNPLFTERGLGNVFRLCGRDDQQGLIGAEYIAKNYGSAKVAIVHDRSAYGKGLADEVKRVLATKKITPAMYEAITPGEKDYSALISKMKAAQIEIVFFGGYHQEAGLIVRQAKDQAMNLKLMGGDALATKEFWAITGDSGAGTLMTFSPDPRTMPSAAPVVERFKKAGIDPEGYTLYTYATMQVLAQAAQKAGSWNSNDLLKILHNGKFDTVMGPLSFGAKGDVNAPGYVVYEWKGGKYVYAANGS